MIAYGMVFGMCVRLLRNSDYRPLGRGYPAYVHDVHGVFSFRNSGRNADYRHGVVNGPDEGVLDDEAVGKLDRDDSRKAFSLQGDVRIPG